MKKLIVLTASLSLGFGSSALAESSYMPEYLEEGLVKICKTAALDKRLQMSKEIRSLRLKTRVVALNVVCNGQDIISFAEQYGAVKTTAKLSNSIGSVQVTDLASITGYKYDVNFEF
ncbi:DUF3718 domain-containing protein [Thalassotalea sp. PLHSN55]|uniref:DUF3718 domain-containing protein n=1 Tax=Thalassotalea sp. PLHSN55 TaxID=3435888 RepID=UPI003F824126